MILSGKVSSIHDASGWTDNRQRVAVRITESEDVAGVTFLLRSDGSLELGEPVYFVMTTGYANARDIEEQLSH